MKNELESFKADHIRLNGRLIIMKPVFHASSFPLRMWIWTFSVRLVVTVSLQWFGESPFSYERGHCLPIVPCFSCPSIASYLLLRQRSPRGLLRPCSLSGPGQGCFWVGELCSVWILSQQRSYFPLCPWLEHSAMQ